MSLVGAWRLQRFVITFADGRAPLYPFGEDATGQIIYSASGQMSAVLSRSQRAPLSATSLERAYAASAEAKAHAFDGYLSYAGTYRLEGDEVVHRVEMSMVPDTVGLEQRRRITWHGEILELSYEVTARSGITRRYTLRWEKIPSTSP